MEAAIERIHLTATGDAQDEIVFVASTIRRLVREKGYRYKDIAIVAEIWNRHPTSMNG